MISGAGAVRKDRGRSLATTVAILWRAWPGAAPAESAPQSSAAPVQGAIELVPEKDRRPVPYELVHDHIFFRARVGGRDVWAMLDNGSGRTVVDRGFAQ